MPLAPTLRTAAPAPPHLHHQRALRRPLPELRAGPNRRLLAESFGLNIQGQGVWGPSIDAAIAADQRWGTLSPGSKGRTVRSAIHAGRSACIDGRAEVGRCCRLSGSLIWPAGQDSDPVAWPPLPAGESAPNWPGWGRSILARFGRTAQRMPAIGPQDSGLQGADSGAGRTASPTNRCVGRNAGLLGPALTALPPGGCAGRSRAMNSQSLAAPRGLLAPFQVNRG